MCVFHLLTFDLKFIVWMHTGAARQDLLCLKSVIIILKKLRMKDFET